MSHIYCHSLQCSMQIAIADHDGIIQIFSFRKGDLDVTFKSSTGPPCSSVCLGGTRDGPQDKIFVACGNEVQGYTKKGKQFLGFDTSAANSITSM